MLTLRFVMQILSVGLLILGANVTSGQDYPTKPIRITTSTPGSGSDVIARLIAQAISGPLGQPVVVENRVALLSTEVVSKSPPDGYTLLVNGGNVWLTPLLQKASYDPVRDLLPITVAARTPNIIVVHPSLPVKSVKELIALAKANPGQLNYATSGSGSSSHISGELFKSMAGINIVRVNYKGAPQALNDLLSGQVQVNFPAANVAMPLVKSGRLKALAITSAQPSELYPGISTVALTGLPGYEAVQVTGIWCSAKTPATVVNRLHREIVRVLNLPDTKEKFSSNGLEPVGNSPEEFAAYIKSEIVNMAKLIKDADIKID